jgi:hypothetical protein
MAKFLNLLKLRGFTSPSDAAVEISATTDSASASRLRIDAGGKLTWGDGINAGDTNLYRQLANVLQTDDYFVATGGLTVESYQITTNGASTGNTLVFDGTKFTPGNATGGAAGSTYVTTIGNGASTTFAVTHNLNTRDVFVQVRGATSPYEVIDVQWEATSTSVVTFNFGTPPAADSVRVAIYAAVTGDNVAIPLDGLTDVVITAPEEFQGLSYNGANWVNSHIPLVSYVRNAEATTITTGTCVYLFGATGDHATVKRADNNSDTTSSKTIGVAGANILASENGPIVTRGYVDGIDLSVGYTAGDILWLGENGAFTTTKPTAPDHLVFIGVVVRATNNGIIYVATQNGYELDELHNVSLPSPNAGDVLTYNGSLWVAASAGGSSVTVNDTAPVSPEVGDLWYKSDTGQTFVYYDSYWVEIGGAGSLPDGSVTAAKIANETIVNANIAANAQIAQSKISNLTSDLLLKAPLQSPTFTGTISTSKATLGAGGKYNAGMQDGAIELGNTSADMHFTPGTWPSVMSAGILQNCSDRFEHVVHDGGTRLASSMYYDGPANTIYVGRDIGWGTSILANPGIPAMRAYCGYVDGHSAITNGVFTATQIPLNNRSCMPTSGTGAYQNFYAPVAGYYHCTFMWGIISHTAGYYYGAYFQIDGATPDGAYVSYFKPPTTGNDDGTSIAGTFYLGAGQYVRVGINNQNSVRFQFARFSIHMVG